MNQQPRYVEMLLDVEQEELEAISDALMDAGALSVTLEDADADAPDEQAVYGEPGMTPERLGWNQNVLIALFDSELEARKALAASCLLVESLLNCQPKFRTLEDQDWVALTQSQFDPFEIPGKLWVGPSWLEAPQGVKKLVLDPGSAFGTGSHPTTQLCLSWLTTMVRQGDRVLDYGCGTGVLALGALHAGAASAVGVDIDPIAVRTAQDNAESNQMSHLVKFMLPEGVHTDQKFEVVVANILARPLLALAPLLCQFLKPGGRLILAGLLEQQADEVAAAYAPALEMKVWRVSEGWALLAGEYLVVTS